MADRRGHRVSVRAAHRPEVDDSREAAFGRKIVVMANGCWAFNGVLDRYGKFKPYRGTSGTKQSMELAHRYAYLTLVGPIPDGEEIHHECRNRGCVTW